MKDRIGLLDALISANPHLSRVPAEDFRPDTVRIRRANPSGRHRPRRKHTDEYLIPSRVLKAIRECDRVEALGVGDRVGAVITVTEKVTTSSQIDLAHVGEALAILQVASLADLKKETCLTVSLGRNVGYLKVIQTGPADLPNVFWAHYRERTGQPQLGADGLPIYRRFIAERVGPDTDLVTLLLRVNDHRLFVHAAHYGPPSPRLPGVRGATQQDVCRWHDPTTLNGLAFVLEQPMVARIVKPVARTCPWKYKG